MRHYKQGRERLVAACDEELVGKTLSEGEVELHVDPGFYEGLRVDEEALQVHLRQCTVANLVGERTVNLAIGMGMVDPRNVLRIDGVPHAQWALLF
jgi:hypothetical protein